MNQNNQINWHIKRLYIWQEVLEAFQSDSNINIG